MSAALISLVGAPGSGKTTVARWLAEALPAQLILEDYAGNPYLAEGYAGRTDLRLPAQTWFLLSRVDQLARFHWLAEGAVVSDYAFLQDAVYAHIWLSGAELATYEKLSCRVAGLVWPPQVLVYLDAPVGLLMERIAGRGRDYERHFTPDFLARLRADYSAALAAPPCPAVAVDMAARDLRRPDEQQWLLAAIRERLQADRCGG